MSDSFGSDKSHPVGLIEIPTIQIRQVSTKEKITPHHIVTPKITKKDLKVKMFQTKHRTKHNFVLQFSCFGVKKSS